MVIKTYSGGFSAQLYYRVPKITGAWNYVLVDPAKVNLGELNCLKISIRGFEKGAVIFHQGASQVSSSMRVKYGSIRVKLSTYNSNGAESVISLEIGNGGQYMLSSSDFRDFWFYWSETEYYSGKGRIIGQNILTQIMEGIPTKFLSVASHSNLLEYLIYPGK